MQLADIRANKISDEESNRETYMPLNWTIKKILSAVTVGIVFASSVAFAKDNLKMSEFELMTFAGEKFKTDPATKQKISQGVVITSAGQTDLIYTGDALKKDQANDVLAKMLMKTAVREIRPDVFEVKHTIAISFSAERWGAKGEGESGDVETVFEIKKNDLGDLVKIKVDSVATDSQSADLTAKGVELFKKYGYTNLTPEFQELFAAKMHQFVWSVNQQLPEIVTKLIERYPEAKSSSINKNEKPKDAA